MCVLCIYIYIYIFFLFLGLSILTLDNNECIIYNKMVIRGINGIFPADTSFARPLQNKNTQTLSWGSWLP
jgi:hypothetical protein